jgi:dipeptide transport system permease protein
MAAKHSPCRRERCTPPGPWREFWTSFSANRGAVIGLVTVVVLLLVALFAPWIAPHAPTRPTAPPS